MGLRTAVGTGGALVAAGAAADYSLNMQPGATPTSRLVLDLHMLAFWVCLAIGALVFAVLAYSLVCHRRGRHPIPARFEHNAPLETLWTLVPLLILIGLALAATRTLILMADTSNPDLTVKVTGYQWRWHYEYLDQGVAFFSNLATDREAIAGRAPKSEHYLREVDNPLVLPVGKKVRFLIASNDVIHSWWVPALGWKQDAIPGFIHDAWARIERPGTYRGQCAELCGKDHAFMPAVVVARPEAQFQEWLDGRRAAARAESAAAARPWGQAELLERGKGVYGRICAACHQVEGQGVPGVFPALKGSPVTAGPLDAHLAVVLNGRPGTAMVAFGSQLSDADLAAVLTYERSAFGGVEQAVQPAEVESARARLKTPPLARGAGDPQ
jgi:cytochrome c oxidase subunit 2